MTQEQEKAFLNLQECIEDMMTFLLLSEREKEGCHEGLMKKGAVS